MTQTAALIDGRAQAAALRQNLKQACAQLPTPPRLATILVGDDAASQVYVANKLKACAEVGITTQMERLPATTTADELARTIDRLNADPTINGILLQLPLPDGLDAQAMIARLNPAKDVDGLHPLNAGLLAQGQRSGFIPCTPHGCLQLIKSVRTDLAGLRALVIGRSVLVGRPMAQLLLQENCTVTLAHSHTQDMVALAAQSDILVAAAGQPSLVQPHWIKPGAIVIDVGITRTATGVVGDVATSVRNQPCALTPVPGGVGPMTIANLLANTLTATCRQTGYPLPASLHP